MYVHVCMCVCVCVCDSNLITSSIGDDVKFGDLLADKNSFKTFLTDNLGLSEPVATAIINSTIHTQNVNYYYKVMYLFY